MATKMTFLYMRAVGLCAVALAFWLVIGSDARVLHQTCGATHPSVGFTADMVEISHDLRGTFTVVDDCTFKIENFSYDGTGPAVYWWGNTDASPSQLRYGKMVVDEKVPAGGGSGTTYTGTLTDGVTWDDIKILSAWCVAFNVDFGHVVIA